MCVSSSGWAGYACLFQILRKVTHSLTEILSFASRFFFPWLNKWLRGACLGLCAGWCTLSYAGFLVKEKRQAPRRAVVCRCVSLTPCRGVQWHDKNALMLGRYVCTGVWDSLARHTQSTA